MSTVHGASPVFLRQLCSEKWTALRACSTFSLQSMPEMLTHESYWSIVRGTNTIWNGGKGQGGFSCCGFVQTVWCRCRTIQGEPQGSASPAPMSILNFWEAQKGKMCPVGKMRHWAPSPRFPDKPSVLPSHMWELHQQRWRGWGIREDKNFVEVHHSSSAASKAFQPSYESCRAMVLPAT